MSRVVLYTIADNGWVVPMRKAYRKARYRKKMGRIHICPEFQKNRKNRYIKDELLDYFKNEIQQEDDFTSKVQTAIAADALIRAIFGEDNDSERNMGVKDGNLSDNWYCNCYLGGMACNEKIIKN